MPQLVPPTNHLQETSTLQFGEGDRRKRRFTKETPRHWKLCVQFLHRTVDNAEVRLCKVVEMLVDMLSVRYTTLNSIIQCTYPEDCFTTFFYIYMQIKLGTFQTPAISPSSFLLLYHESYLCFSLFHLSYCVLRCHACPS